MNRFPIELFAVFLGGGCGAVLRWLMSLKWNPSWPFLPYGTLAANLCGALAIGVLLAFFSTRIDWGPEIRLFCITGLLGGLTTFSTFSSEVVLLFSKGHFSTAFIHLGSNVLGSFLLTAFGLYCGKLLFK